MARVTDILQNNVSWHQIAIERAEKYKELKQLVDFNFDFNVSDRTRAFGEIRTLIENTGLKIRFAAMQIWYDIIPTKLIKVTITELNELYEGYETGKPDKDWKGSDFRVSKTRFLAFWNDIIKPALDEIPNDLTDQSRLLGIFGNNFNDLQNILRAQIPVQEIPTTAKFSDAIDIFDKINSRGVHLSKGELALTHVTSKWPDARRILKDFQTLCETRSFI